MMKCNPSMFKCLDLLIIKICFTVWLQLIIDDFCPPGDLGEGFGYHSSREPSAGLRPPNWTVGVSCWVRNTDLYRDGWFHHPVSAAVSKQWKQLKFKVKWNHWNEERSWGVGWSLKFKKMCGSWKDVNCQLKMKIKWNHWKYSTFRWSESSVRSSVKTERSWKWHTEIRYKV